jgi:hypothetical protein
VDFRQLAADHYWPVAQYSSGLGERPLDFMRRLEKGAGVFEASDARQPFSAVI